MLGGRTAMPILVGCLFLSPAPHGAVAVDSPATGASAPASQQPVLSIGCFPARPAQTTRIAVFVRWRARPKIVLGETNQQVVEEIDRGPAFMPAGHSPCAGRTGVLPRFGHIPPALLIRPFPIATLRVLARSRFDLRIGVSSRPRSALSSESGRRRLLLMPFPTLPA